MLGRTRPMSSRETLDEKETARLEAFSDGVFAFAITLLALNLRDPAGSGVSLSEGLISEWPAFFAFVTSFVTVLIMWMNHHNMFNYIRRVDSDGWIAAAVYSGTFFFLSLVWNGLWRYCVRGHRLLGTAVTDQQARTITRQYAVAPVSYGIAFVIAPFSGLVSVGVILAVAAFFAVTATIGE
ncbi:MAG: DUF1211 domain-containing protein [Methanobacteriota archaeon]|nr:MAG: DUF1211 domain-containing protein [Euryarchaeota archaeon]